MKVRVLKRATGEYEIVLWHDGDSPRRPATILTRYEFDELRKEVEAQVKTFERDYQ